MKRVLLILGAVCMLVGFGALSVSAQEKRESRLQCRQDLNPPMPNPFEVGVANDEFKLMQVQRRRDLVLSDFLERENPLLMAVKFDRVDIVKELLKREDVEVNGFCSFGKSYYSPLMVAVSNNRIDIVKELLKREDVDVNMRSMTLAGFFDSPLLVAMRLNHMDIVKELLKREDLYANGKGIFPSPLTVAVWKNNVDIVKELLKREEVVSERAECQRAIKRARLQNHEEAARLIEEALQTSDAQLEAAISSQLNSSLSGK